MIHLNIDLSSILDLEKDFKPRVDAALAQAAQELALATHGHILEEVQQKLHSTREKYTNALGYQQINEHTWAVNLDASAMFIEEGMCVLYANRRTAPSVLTPDGPIPCTDVKVGTLVLNKDGEWTSVLRVFDRHLWEDYKETVDEDSTREKFGYSPADLSIRSKKPICVRCPFCRQGRSISKYDFSRLGYTICPTCPKQDVFRVKINKADGGELWLTGEHPVLTTSGWILAKDLPKTSELLAPYWGKCKGCESKTLLGRDWCSSGCAAKIYNFRRLADGTHPSQQPDWLANVYKKVIANGGRISGAEEKVAEHLCALGLKVDWCGEHSKDSDCIRQYRFTKNKDKCGRQRYYFADFYFPKLGLVLEVDGKVFHSVAGDEQRDVLLSTVHGVHTIRIPANNCYKPTKLAAAITSILSNHAGDIEFRPVPITVQTVSPQNGFCLVHRWDITVARGSSFVCQGVVIHNSGHEMVNDLLKSPKAKTAKDGSRYLAVPFQQNKGPSSSTPAQQDLTKTIKSELKRRNIPYGKLEKDQTGQVKTGTLHSFDIMSKPVKTGNGPGQGHGPLGSVRQGMTGIPFLQGVRVLQKGTKGKDGKTNYSRHIMTFRIVSSKHAGSGRWQHPGLEARRFFDSARDWAIQQWETQIAPKLMEELASRL